jgi:hypothetical protein
MSKNHGKIEHDQNLMEKIGKSMGKIGLHQKIHRKNTTCGIHYLIDE